MKREGMNFKLAPHLSWRDSDPNRDVDTNGYPIKHTFYVAIVLKKDCVLYVKDGKNYIDTKDAPSIPIDHGGTHYGYGKSRKYRNYYTRPVYLVSDGRVFTATLRYDTAPKDYKGE